jgi:ABC-type Mn2+/Zn2+ transport system ATPase subunit
MGQTNRFLLFMTLAKKSDYYIIDELLNAIDSEKKLRILEVIKNQNGMLLISHDEGVIEYLMNDYQIFDV